MTKTCKRVATVCIVGQCETNRRVIVRLPFDSCNAEGEFEELACPHFDLYSKSSMHHKEKELGRACEIEHGESISFVKSVFLCAACSTGSHAKRVKY